MFLKNTQGRRNYTPSILIKLIKNHNSYLIHLHLICRTKAATWLHIFLITYIVNKEWKKFSVIHKYNTGLSIILTVPKWKIHKGHLRTSNLYSNTVRATARFIGFSMAGCQGFIISGAHLEKENSKARYPRGWEQMLDYIWKHPRVTRTKSVQVEVIL